MNKVNKQRIGILTSHPIQYQAPLFRELAKRVDLSVFFAHQSTAKNQSDAGFEVEFTWDQNLTSGFKHYFLENRSSRPSITRFSGCNTPEISELIKLGQFDAFIVYGWHFKSYLQAIWACNRFQVPVFVRTDSHNYTSRSFIKRFIKRIFYPIFFSRINGFLPVGTYSTDYLTHFNVPKNRIHPVPYCIDSELFESYPFTKIEKNGFLQDIGAQPDDMVLLFVGKFIACKRIEDFISVLELLKNKSMRVCAILVGSGPLEQKLKEQAESLNISVHFAGFKNQSALSKYYSIADVMILPSDSETWGLSVNESFACGTPAIVSSAVGCQPDLIEEGYTGMSYPVGSIEKLLSAICYLSQRIELPEVKNAIKDKAAKYTPQASADSMIRAVLNT